MTIDEIWTEYQSNIKSFLHSKISNPAEVDDLLQDILIKTYNNLHTLKSNDSVKSWLFQITNNTIIDFYRKNRRTVEINADELWYEESNAEGQQALAHCVEPLIQALPEQTAELLMLIDIQGQSQKAYAQRVGISYSTLKSKVQKARGQLRKLFEDCCNLSIDRYGNIAEFEPKSATSKKC